MRALVLVALVLCASCAVAVDAPTARGRYAQRLHNCRRNISCQQVASSMYVVESRREQDAQAAETSRCEHVVGSWLRCDVIDPADATEMRQGCIAALQGRSASTDYATVLCVEQSQSCSDVDTCSRH